VYIVDMYTYIAQTSFFIEIKGRN